MRRAASWLVVAALATPAGARDLPAWLEAARATVSPAAGPAVPFHLLLHEREVHCSAKGRNLIVDRAAVRVLARSGAPEAMRVRVDYDRTSARVRELHAWLVAPDGHVTVFDDHDAVDVSVAEWGSLKTDARARVLQIGREVPPADALPGTVFGWEWAVEEEPLFADQVFGFGSDVPTAVERFRLQLPAGVEPRVLAFGNDIPPPMREGDTWRWERRDVPALAEEAASATGAAWHHAFVVTPRVSPGASPMPGRSFSSWGEVSRWLVDLSEASTAPSSSIVAAARAGASSTPLERARTLGRSVQAINYVSVAVGLVRGEGYRPHPAAEVQQAGYGDCKDKANLFCALARAAGLEAWLVSASTEGRDHVRPEWPSPAQFDHCIAALRVPEGTALDAVVEKTPLGSLLFFDATDPYTPMGSLPERLQGSWVLLEDADRGALLRLPAANARRARSRWTFRASIDSTGAMDGTWDAVLRGGDAHEERLMWSAGETSARQGCERMFADWLGGCRIEDLEHEDLPDSDAVHNRLRVRADRFGRRMGERMVAFRMAPAVAAFEWDSRDTTRRTPVALAAWARTDSIVLRLPGGWRADELPEPVAEARDFGEFRARWAMAGDELTATFETRLEPVTLPPGRYRELLAFGDAVRRAQRTSVVLVHP